MSIRLARRFISRLAQLAVRIGQLQIKNMQFIATNIGWLITFAVVLMTQLIIYGNLPKRVEILEIHVNDQNILMHKTLEDFATIIANQENSKEQLRTLINLHTKA